MGLKPYEILEQVVSGSKLAVKILDKPHLAWLTFKLASLALYKKETWWNEANRFGFQKMGSGTWTPAELDAQKYDSMVTLEYHQGILDARYNETPVVWLDWPVPIEIVKGFDAVAFVPESFMATSNVVGMRGHIACLEAVEKAGISDDICAMDRITLGAYFLEQMPAPDAIISVAHPCDAGRTTNQLLEYVSGAPAYTINTSYTKSDVDVELYSKNLFGAIEFLEEVLKQKFNWVRFEEMVNVLNEHNFYLNEITEMNKNIPSPGLTYSIQNMWLSKLPNSGNPLTVECSKRLYKIAKHRIKHPGSRKKKEKFRIIIADMPIVFTDLFKWIEKTYGGVVVSDYIGDAIYPKIDMSSKETMIMGVAKDRLYAGMIKQAHGAVEETVDDLERQIDNFSADCIIFNGHQGCKHNRAFQRIIKDVCKRSGLPYLFMEADIFDSRVMAEDDIKRDLTNFFISNGFA
jgi:benzoyl-CoA reductase/2-hydroxyglutaryl-CoA dehydratase subunit BcrC/BadD/HgdB